MKTILIKKTAPISDDILRWTASFNKYANNMQYQFLYEDVDRDAVFALASVDFKKPLSELIIPWSKK